jgi:diguanylate cyclase (GGDEF)-like protein/PAS domain S-box-containing protein
MIRILYADGSQRDRDLVRPFLAAADHGFHVTEVRTLPELCESVQARDCDLVLGDFDLSGCLGLELVHAVQARRPGLPIVILTADKDRAHEAVKLGVNDCLSKTPDELTRLPHIVRAAIGRTRLEHERRLEKRLLAVGRARKLLAEGNRLNACFSEEPLLLQDACRVLVESGAYCSAWVGLVESDEAKTIRPIASAGDDLDQASAKLWCTDNMAGRGLVDMAIRTRTAQVRQHLQVDPHFSTQSNDARAQYGAAAVVPLICDNAVAGVIGTLSTDAEAFAAEELAPLDEIAREVAYGMSSIRLKARQHRAEQLLRLEHTVTRCLAEAGSVGNAVSTVIRAVCETQAWDCGRYFRLDEAASVLRFDDAWGVASADVTGFIERSRAIVVGRGVGLAGHVWDSGEPLWIADITRDNRTLGTVYTPESGIRGAFLFPVKSEGKVHGVLAFSSREIREPDERLLEAVRVIGSQIGQFLHRKQAEAVLRESEARFRSLMQLSSDMFWEQDEQYRFTAFAGTGPDSMEADRRHLGERRWDRQYLNMTEADWAAHVADLDARRPFRDLELCWFNDAGHQVWISVSGEPKFDASGVFTGYRGVGKDITARKREQHLLALEHAVNRGITAADNVSDALRAVLRAVGESEGWECGRYFTVDEAAEALKLNTWWHLPDPVIDEFINTSREAVIKRGAGLAGRAWESGQPVWSMDVANDNRALRPYFTSNAGMRGVFVFPVSSENQTIGIMVFSSREVREPDDRLLRAVRAIGSQVGQFVERKRGEAVLRESEARFRSLTTLSSDWYWEQDEEHRFLNMSDEIERRTGVSATAHIGKRRWELPAPNMTEADWAAHRAVVEAHQSFHDLELCRIAEDGSRHWVTVNGEPMFDANGVFKGYRGIGRDITARKREDQLVALEHAVTRSLAEADTSSTGLKAVMRSICESEGWECGRYLSVDEAAGVMRLSEFWGRDDPAVEQFIAGKREAVYGSGIGLAGRVWHTGQPLWSADTTLDERGFGSAVNLATGMRGAFVFPVTAEGKTIGVLSFNSREVKDPDERLLQAVHAIGSQIGQFLQRKRADEKIRGQALQQRLIAEFGQQALASADLTEVLEGASLLVASTLKAEYSSVLQLQSDGKQLIYRAAIGWPEEWVGHRIVSISPGSRLEYILNRAQALVIEDYVADTQFTATALQVYGIRSGVQVPILGTRMAYGVLSVHTQEPRRFTDEEVSFLRSVTNILAIAIQRKNAEDKLAHLAQFDTVTSLPNRYLLRDRLGQALTQAHRNHWLGAVLFVDLDRFKAVNDTFGHSVGDKMLRAVATRLNDCVRGGDTVARLSGDEFAVVLSNLSKSDDAGLVAQKIVTALAAPFDLDGHQTYISASVGIALYPDDGNEPESLLKNADTAMYRAKEQGRNCYQFYVPQMNDRLMERMQLEGRLRGALDRREFLLHYQPKVALDTGTISGFEALLRWKQDDRLVPPGEFIPILEDTGLIVPVGEWVLRTVCEQIKQWQERSIAPRPIAVNLSSRQFQHQYLVAVVERILRETGVASELLEFELTETMLMSDAEEAVQMLRDLKALGVRLSVDDFGTGYSSLTYLKRFPLDTLKIDRVFVRDAVSNPDDATLTRTIVNLAHSMRLRVVAEGVETPGQLNFLRQHGCDEMQGYYFAPPLEVEECTEALLEDRRLQNPDLPKATGVPVLLLVDDSEADLMLLKRALAGDTYHIITAQDATAGFEMLARHGADIVVSDFQMPGMNGIEFLANVRKLYPDAVRVIATGGDMPTITRAINDAGIHKFLSKNWDAELLRSGVGEAYELSRRRTETETATAGTPLPAISIQ